MVAQTECAIGIELQRAYTFFDDEFLDLEQDGAFTFFDDEFPDQENIFKRRRVSISYQRSVRFSDDVTIFTEKEDLASVSPDPHVPPLPSLSSWLTPNDLSKIQNGIHTTLEMIKVSGDFFGHDTPLSARYCSRGLEDYDVERKGCLKMSTVERRQGAICSVLNEQSFQRQRHMQQVRCMQGAMSALGMVRDDCHMVQTGSRKLSSRQRQQLNSQRQQYKKRLYKEIAGNLNLDHFRISEIYQQQTHFSAMEAIETGRRDSEDALAVYRSDPLPIATNVLPVQDV